MKNHETWSSSWGGSSEKPGSAIAVMADLSADHEPLLALPVSHRSRERSGGAAKTPEPESIGRKPMIEDGPTRKQPRPEGPCSMTGSANASTARPLPGMMSGPSLPLGAASRCLAPILTRLHGAEQGVFG